MKHLLSIDDLGRDGIDEMLGLAESFLEVSRRDIRKVPALRGKTIVSLFYEDSTRTRLSFETAAKRLSADVMTFSVSTSAVAKGESLKDTVQTVAAMGVDAVIVRHRCAGAPALVAGWIDASIVNAGDGRHEHPTQALLDVFTIRQHLGASLDGLRVAIVGDVRHSRVARSTSKALAALGADVTLVGPPTLLPESLVGWNATGACDLDEVLPKVDVVYMLRIQHERQDAMLFPRCVSTPRYGLTIERCPPGPGRAGDAPGADEPRRRDRARGRGRPRVAHHRAGGQRCRGPHGGPL